MFINLHLNKHKQDTTICLYVLEIYDKILLTIVKLELKLNTKIGSHTQPPHKLFEGFLGLDM